MNRSMLWRAAAAVALCPCAALAAPDARNPAIRVSVLAATGDAAGAAESADDVRAILQRERDGVLAQAADGETAEIVLRLGGRRTRIDRPQGGSAATAGKPVCILGASVEEPGATNAAASARMAEGISLVWRDAAARLVEAVAQLVEARQHVLLRRRADWRDVGFVFDEPTDAVKERAGAKDGKVAVIAIKAFGAAQAAGLNEGDVVLSADGKKLKNAAELARAIYTAARATGMKLEVARRGERRALVLTIP